ncbi:MAG: hypothetical protein KF745_14445 [Phycisphaeraceae bacterium]|nr:hypothetical protein [Phycisphaeraceae bacterium]
MMLLAIPAAGLLMGGCYERVVGAKGPGSDQYSVEQKYQSNSAVDDWIFGPQKQPKSTLLDRKSN